MTAGSLYQAVLGPEFAALPAAVRRFHSLRGRHELHGWVEAEAPRSLPARLLALCLGTPQRGRSGALRFELEAAGASERWTRHFPGQTMRSRLSLGASHLVEQLGPVRLTFALTRRDSSLAMELRRLEVLRIPFPRWLLPRIVAEETGSGDRLHFHVRACMPLAGQVACYRGYLQLPAEEKLS
jgi:hypothetical protein